MLRKKIIISIFVAICLVLILSACEHNESQDQSNLHDTHFPDPTQEGQTTSNTTESASTSVVEETKFQERVTADEIIFGEEYIERIFHIVAENETFEDIANLHDTTVEILRQVNWFLEDDYLHEGLPLKIPPVGFPLHQDIEIRISEVSNEQIDADIIFDFQSTLGSNLLIEIDSSVQDIKIFYQDLSRDRPRMPHVTPVIGYIRSDSNPGQIILLSYDHKSSLTVGIKFTDEDGMERYFAFFPYDEWVIYDLTVDFWSAQD